MITQKVYSVREQEHIKEHEYIPPSKKASSMTNI